MEISRIVEISANICLVLFEILIASYLNYYSYQNTNIIFALTAQ